MSTVNLVYSGDAQRGGRWRYQAPIDEDLTMLIGPASDGALLEIGVLDIDGDDPVVIHAMPLRPKFYRFLG